MGLHDERGRAPGKGWRGPAGVHECSVSGILEDDGNSAADGADFDDRDAGKKTTVAIVNRKFATHFFGDASPIGRHIGFGDDPKTKLDIEIVGVAQDSLYEGPRDGVHRQVFIPFSARGFPASASFYVRTTMDSSAMSAELRRKIAALDPAMPVYQMRTLETQLDETLGTERLIATLSAAFGIWRHCSRRWDSME